MKRIFVLILAFALLLPGLALAEGETPPASPAAETTPDAEPTASPVPTPVPAPTPTPIVDQLIIDSRNLYNGMDKTYGDGYVPRVVNGRVYIILPLLGETYDGKVTVTADLGTTVDSPFVFGNYSQTVGAGWSSYVFVFEIPLVKGRINGSYPVTFRADYLDVLGQQKQQGFTVYVTITDGKNPPDPNDVPKQEVEKPELFISACTVSPDVIGGEEEFTVTVTIDNIGAIRARSVRLSYGSEAAGIVPVETNSAMHLPNIASGESETASFRLRTTKDVLAGEQPFYITLDYVDLYGGVYSGTRTFLAHVTQPAEMSYDSVSMPREVRREKPYPCPPTYSTLGKAPCGT